MTATVAELMRRNLLDVFNERDDSLRATAIGEVYAEGVVWHEPDGVVHGRAGLAERAAALLAEFPDFVFEPVTPVSVNDDLGHLGFRFGPAGLPPAVTGMDIARCQDGRIVELYTFLHAPG